MLLLRSVLLDRRIVDDRGELLDVGCDAQILGVLGDVDRRTNPPR